MSLRLNVSKDGNITSGGYLTTNNTIRIGTQKFTKFNDVSLNNLEVSKDLIVKGNMNVDGSFNFKNVIRNDITINNEIMNSTQLDISNNGTGPALEVTQYGTNEVAIFSAGEEGNSMVIDGSGNIVMYKDLSINGVLSINDPVNNSDAVHKKYVDELLDKLDSSMGNVESSISVLDNSIGIVEKAFNINIIDNVFWTKLGSDIDGETQSDRSGVSVSLSSDGNIVAIEASYNDGNGSNSGNVRIYEYKTYTIDMSGNYHYTSQNSTYNLPLIITGGTEPEIGNSYWTQLGNDIDGEAASDRSGYSVSLSSDGNIVAIGAINNDGNGVDSGHVRVYEYNDISWVKLGDDIDGEAPGDQSGWSVSLSSHGNIVAIGAIKNDGNGENSGHVRIYEYNDISWVKLGNDIDGEANYDDSGVSVSLSSYGNIVAIGARYNDGNGNNSGNVRIYEYKTYTIDMSGNYHYTSQNSTENLPLIITGGTDPEIEHSYWTQLGNDIDGEALVGQSGWSVSLSSDGKIVAIGAINNDGNGVDSGHVRVYEYNDISWVKLGDDIGGEAPGDQSGDSVSLSSDGKIVAIGAINNDGNGENSGHVRIYEYVNNVWTKLGNDIDGEALGDGSGDSVSLSSDGNIVAIGARYNDGNRDKSGHVRIYNLNRSSVNVDIETNLNGRVTVSDPIYDTDVVNKKYVDDVLNNSMGIVETSVNRLDNSMGIVESSINRLDSSMNKVETSVNRLDNSMNNVESSISILDNYMGIVETISGELVTLKNDGQNTPFYTDGSKPPVQALLTNTYIQDSVSDFGTIDAGVYVYNVNITLSVSSGTWNENPDLQVIDYGKFSFNGVFFTTFAIPYATKTSATQVFFTCYGIFRARDNGGNGTPSGPGLWLGIRPTFIFSTIAGTELTPINIQTQVILGGFAKITN